jgi:hypothetical protein
MLMSDAVVFSILRLTKLPLRGMLKAGSVGVSDVWLSVQGFDSNPRLPGHRLFAFDGEGSIQ